MALAVSTVIADARFLFNDDQVPTAAQALRLLNRARHEVFKRVLPIEDEYSISTIAYTYKSSIPAYDLSSSTALNVNKIKNIEWWDKSSSYKLSPLTLVQYNKKSLSESNTVLDSYYVQNRTLLFYPKLNDSADTLTLAGTHTNAVTTIHTDSDIDTFPPVGRFLVTDAVNGNEVISYQRRVDAYTVGTVTVTNTSTTVTGSGTKFSTNLTAGDKFSIDDSTWYTISSITSETVLVLTGAYSGTTATGSSYYAGAKFTGCTRGEEDSAAYEHGDGDTATERDIIVTYYRMPRDLAVGDTVEDMYAANADVLVFYIAWQSLVHDTDGVGNTGAMNQAQMFYANYREALMDFQFDHETERDDYYVIGQPNTVSSRE